jgi:hypothetical protein
MEAADAHLLARASQGSIGRALALDAKAYRARRDALLEIVGALTANGSSATPARQRGMDGRQTQRRI